MGSRPIVVYAFLLTGVISMVGGYGCSEGVKYETYVSKDPKLNVTMPYIKGWSFRESRGSYDSYAQVVFYQPQDNDKSRKAGIILTVKESAKVAFSPLTIEA